MNLNLYYNKLLLFILLSISFGRILTPTSDSANSELLERNNKAREYYQLDLKGLEYSVKGPAEIKIFSKQAFPKKTSKDIKEVSFNIQINDLSTQSNNGKKIDRKTSSSSHPMHVYTYSSKDILVLPAGDYSIRITKESIFDNPILIRLSRTGRKSADIEREEFNSNNYLSKKYQLRSVDGKLSSEYHVLNDNMPLLIENVDGLLELYLRGIHPYDSNNPEIITMTSLKKGRYYAKYHIFCIPHPSTKIDQNDYIPSKLNKIYIESDSSNYLFHINNADKKLLVRSKRLLR